MRKNTLRIATVAALGSLALSGCSQLNQWVSQEESVDYRSVSPGSGNPLSIPPDLTQVGANAPYRAPEGTTSYSQYAQQTQAQAQANASGQVNVLPTNDKVRVMRDGNMRWLSVDMPAETVFPLVVDFWGEQGFTIHSQDPRAGIMETDWAENRAKIPEGWIKSALGFILDSVYDSGERERFRTRLERVNGTTEVYISHDQMVETGTADNTGFKWVEGREDPGLNAAMLARLMVFLGTDVQRAQQLVTQAEKAPGSAQVTQATDQATLTLNEPFDRAWRRVGIAIDSAGFSVDDRDRSTGDYFIRYLDTDTGRKIEQPNFFGRLFGTKNTSEAEVYRVHVSDQGGNSEVSIRDQQGQPDTSETARRIISVLAESMQQP
ncbi:outer membrane protein assembly factor BamC [Pusillimonas sp. CC-YST705]|uniref:Outer membrane protein assembly factor BamC n=1 Tax=Mesopusillimonas faecipullorum TaxID=2755040 RepID=A0ABS8C8U9_9BURK|nr:outer membrane protein assembly factor BamC [Mesopusillimonas faecipullorum]MCB5362269.1 outer membrane protein assembly factor BamC [Mesopusillimonas faecipullorum]